MLKEKHNSAILLAILAAALYAISSPVSKILLSKVSPTMMAALLYLGAGIGMSIIGFYRKKTGKTKEEMKITKKRDALYSFDGCFRYFSPYFPYDRLN